MKEVVEGNKLIAEFCGHKLFAGQVKFSYPVDGGLKGCNQSSMKYHTSWDWLMPVVEKIESIGFETLIKSGWNESKEKLMNEVEIRNNQNGLVAWACEISKIESTHQAIVQFIQWYNNSKTSVESV